MKIKPFFIFLCLTFISICSSAYAAEAKLKTFDKGSYQQILTDYKDKPFVLIIWSITCSSCLKEMAFISELNKQQPELNLVMLTVDDMSVSSQIEEILNKHQLTDLDNWVFAEDNSAKLRFEIDPSWYGELPRTYFFNAEHERTGISGVLNEEKYQSLLNTIKK